MLREGELTYGLINTLAAAKLGFLQISLRAHTLTWVGWTCEAALDSLSELRSYILLTAAKLGAKLPSKVQIAIHSRQRTLVLR